MHEVIAKRNETMKLFDLGEGKVERRFHFSPIHFKEGDQWTEIDVRLDEVNGKFRPRKVGFELNAPINRSEIGLKVGRLSVDFVPVNTAIDFQMIKTGVRKLVTFESKPDSNLVEFEFKCPTRAEIWFTDSSKENKREPIREALKKLNTERVDLEKRGFYSQARALFELQKKKEIELQECDLTKWDKTTEITYSGSMQVRLGKDVVYVRNPLVWDAVGNVENIEIILKRVGDKLLFIKKLPQSFLDNAVYPIKTDATTSYFAGAGDGYVRNLGAASEAWATTRGAATGTSATYTGTTDGLRWHTEYIAVSNRYDIFRPFMPTDTSGITDTDTVDSVSLVVYTGETVSKSDGDTSSIHLVEGTQASMTTLSTADFDAVGSTSWGSLAISSVVADGLTTITGNATFVSNISKTGYTSVAGREGRDLNDSAPTGINRVSGNASEYTGTSRDPYLSVVTTAAAVPAGGSLLMMGI